MLNGFSKNVRIVTLGWVLVSVGFSATMPFLAIYLAEARSIPLVLVGAVFFAQGLVGLVSQVASGFVTDRAGPRRTLLLGYLVSAVSAAAMAYMVAVSLEPIVIIIMYLAFSFLRGLSIPSSAALVADDKGDPVRNFSIITMAMNLGFAIGPAAAGVLLAFTGYAQLFLLSAATALATFFLSLWLDEASYHKVPKKESPRPDTPTLTFILITFMGYLVIGQDIQPFALYASSFVGASNLVVGYLFSFSGLLIVVIQLVISRIIRRYGSVIPTLVGLIFGAVGYYVTSLSWDVPSLFLSMAIITLAEVFFVVPTQIWVTNRSPDTRKGAFQGYYSAVRYSGRSTASWLGSTALGVFFYNPALAWYLVSGLAIASTFSYALHYRKYRLS